MVMMRQQASKQQVTITEHARLSPSHFQCSTKAFLRSLLLDSFPINNDHEDEKNLLGTQDMCSVYYVEKRTEQKS